MFHECGFARRSRKRINELLLYLLFASSELYISGLLILKSG